MKRYAGQTYGELFDLTSDPHELYNRWADLGCRGVRAELTDLMLDTILAAAPQCEPRLGWYS